MDLIGVNNIQLLFKSDANFNAAGFYISIDEHVEEPALTGTVTGTPVTEIPRDVNSTLTGTAETSKWFLYSVRGVHFISHHLEYIYNMYIFKASVLLLECKSTLFLSHSSHCTFIVW